MASNDVFWFRLYGELVASFDESDLVDFNWDEYLKYDDGQEMKLKAKNVSYEMNGRKDFKEYSEIPARFIHSKGDAIALSPGGWRPLAFIPNGAVVLFDKNAFGTIKNHIDRQGNPQPNSIKVVVDFFQNREITIDPKPILLEGNNRFDKRLPSLDEMKKELGFFTAKMQERAPNLTVKATEDSLPQLHRASAVFFQGLDAILEFIDAVYKKYEARYKFPKNLDGFKEIFALAKAANVQGVHLIFAAIVFKAVTGERDNPILQLLKFTRPNFIEEGNSFNGALDIYSIILFLSEIRNHGGNVFFVTADKDLIHLWNDMNVYMMVDDEPGVLHFDMLYFLPGLQEGEVDELQELMKS
ncbi:MULTISPECIES: hypothetical protein [Pseudomonas putida group]|uniref:hypothetical protein n=1 Tax=Pseudomonas putida group TaxID=136845 RepID=UPI000A1068D7|nr:MULTISPECIES: hypothetical protein [Pseudomonas putida group]MEC4024893.1 hypothetical protein [Pseudomonas fulva]ORL53301.1 hypothetical protein B7H18_02610 [Pseudomonas putida]